jgi:hypothetical protein
MTTGEWLKYLHKTFEDRYGRPKTEEDEVHIDEIIPCSAWNLPDDNKYCWHYLNSQWLLAEDNLSKHDSYEEEDKLAMIEKPFNRHYKSLLREELQSHIQLVVAPSFYEVSSPSPLALESHPGVLCSTKLSSITRP